jgi:hypothetical protein
MSLRVVAGRLELSSSGIVCQLGDRPGTMTPSGKAMFQMTAIIQERVRAGPAKARGRGEALGRPTIPDETDRPTRCRRRKFEIRVLW